MIAPQDIERAIASIKNQSDFIQAFLRDTLHWEIPETVENFEDIAYGWTADDLRTSELDKHLLAGTVRQIQKMDSSQPWGIFLLEFKSADVFTTGRGMTTPLRKALRGLVPSKRKQSHLPSWKREHLLFICMDAQYRHYRFAYFKAPEDKTRQAPLVSFGWDPGSPCRTACEFNLPHLAWPEKADPEKWVEEWSNAFDVERVTKRFYEEYARVFNDLQKQIIGLEDGEDRKMFSQALLNRLMFLRFIERKGWLEFDGRTDYLRALHAAGPVGKKSFYHSRLRPLFFQGLAIEHHSVSEAVGRVPFLNGGLFEEKALDKKVKDIPDDALGPVIGEDGLFYRFNFTVEESTPLDIEVAVDPEMLGKVFEELVTGRHESGSYYTPRPIVSFMCREALKVHLTDKTEAPLECEVLPSDWTEIHLN